MHMDTEAAIPPPAESQPIESAPSPAITTVVQATELPPAPPATAPHAGKHHHEGLAPVGIIYGDVGTASFNLSVTGNVEKMEYIQVEHDTDGWVLGQVMDMQRKTDLSLDRAKLISNGEEILIHEKVTALSTLVDSAQPSAVEITVGAWTFFLPDAFAR